MSATSFSPIFDDFKTISTFIRHSASTNWLIGIVEIFPSWKPPTGTTTTAARTSTKATTRAQAEPTGGLWQCFPRL